jgi:hypothetical protein
VTQEKDKTGAGRMAQRTLVGVAPLGAGRPPRPSERASKPPSMPPRSSASQAPSSKAPPGRDFFAALAPPGREGSKGAPAPRHKQASLEEISSSMLLEDDSSSAVMPGLEELSGSLLLEDPTEVRPDLAAPLPQVAPAAQAPVPEREPPAAHRALLGMPDLPQATPAPDLGALPWYASADATQPHQAATEGEGPGLDGDGPTRIMPPAASADSAGVPPPPQHMYEALKGYEAIPAGPAAEPPAVSAPAPVEQGYPSTSPVHGDVEVTSLPVSRWAVAVEGAQALLAKLRASAGETSLARDGKRPWFLGAIALAGLVVGIGLVALIVSLTRKSPDEAADATEKKAPAAAAAPVPAPSETAMATPVEPAAAPAPAPAPKPAAPASTTACTVGGAPRVVAPSAIVSAGVEVRAVGDDVALGFAPNEHQATALRLDAASLGSTSKVDSQSTEAVRRVVPLASADGALSIAADADREGDPVQGRRTLALDPPLEIGAAGGNVVWARPGAPSAGTLWPLEGDGPVEALRGATDLTQDAPTTAVAFRHAGTIWLGTAVGRDALAPVGALTRAGGASSAVGSPAIAASAGAVIAAWADRAAATDPWRLRWVTFKAGEAPGEPGTFTPPAGGRGEQAMSPGIAAVPGGRFLLVWTEGPATHHDVRALTLSRDGQPLGKPLIISAKRVNAGQGQAAVNASGRGAVAFLESIEGGGFQVVATPIKCAP